MKSLWAYLLSPSTFYSERRWYHPMSLARRLINYYLLICVALFVLQNFLIYPRWQTGASLSPGDGLANAARMGLVPWQHPTPGAALPQGYVLPNFNAPAPRGTVVVFHGNGGSSYDREYYAEAFKARGLRTFLYEYPGYGGRPGIPTAGSIIHDAQNLIRSLDAAGLGPVYIWGESLGSGIAAEVCRNPTLPVHGLTLMMPWDSFSHTAASHYPIVPVSVLLWDKYNSIANLRNFAHPICIIVGTEDNIVPMPLGLNLYDHLSCPKKLIVQQGYGHGDWPCSQELSWWDDALNFIAPPKSTEKP